MGIDRPGEDDQPVVLRAADQVESRDVDRSAVLMETRDREAYYTELRAAVEAERRTSAEEPDPRHADRDQAGDEWRSATEQFREAWTEHQSRWPRPERERGEAVIDADGWHGDGGRHLDREANATVDRGCERIREVEATTITPAMRRIEAQDPDHELVGFEHRLKGTDRIKEKVADTLDEQPALSASDAMRLIPDTLRYTLRYAEERYTAGVRADISRAESMGFELMKLKNSWSSDQYRGINSQWRDPETDQRFEIQFHTQVSFEAKQLTHGPYERKRNPETNDAELDELARLQHQMCASIPIPTDATSIEDYPKRGRHG